jgi:hypothetical protein
MCLPEFGEIKAEHSIAVEEQERQVTRGKVRFQLLKSSAGTEDFRPFDGPVELETEQAPLDPGIESDHQSLGLVEGIHPDPQAACVIEVDEGVSDQRPSQERDPGLGHGLRKRAESCAKTSTEDECLHTGKRKFIRIKGGLHLGLRRVAR